jgi:histidyl-tRNA synthetase
MSLQAVKGTRDFYPEQMALRNWMTDAWRRVSLRNGFVEFDGPELEMLDLYRVKSGDEIVSQLFSLTDRAGRELALRPEITPTLARMVNAKINSLPRPIKWFSVPRVFRAENPQKGRLREFFQWNVDYIGSDDVLADAECIFACVDLLGEVGLTSDEVKVRYSSRRLLSAVLRAAGVAEADIPPVLAALDKRSKLPPEAFEEVFAKALPDEATRTAVAAFLADENFDDPAAALPGVAVNEEILAGIDNLRQFQQALRAFGIEDWCQYDTSVVRGLAYYTGIVYEVFDAGATLRAVAGGGRYDNLLEVLGGPKVGATGFGMGDAVIGILLEEKGKLPALKAQLDCFVLDGEGEGGPERLPALLSLVGRLRRGNISTDFAARGGNIGKLLKEANRRQARCAVILRGDMVAVKNLASGEQVEITREEFLAGPRQFLPRG